MTLAELFQIEFHQLPVMDDGRIDGLDSFRKEWVKVAIEITEEIDRGAQDPTEVYKFEDGSEACLVNPKQAWYPANTALPDALMLKWRRLLSMTRIRV